MEGTNVIWCGVDPKVHDTDRSTLIVQRQEEEMQGNALLLYLFTAIDKMIQTDQSVILVLLK